MFLPFEPLSRDAREESMVRRLAAGTGRFDPGCAQCYKTERRARLYLQPAQK
jgi:hypothetical protein